MESSIKKRKPIYQTFNPFSISKSFWGNFFKQKKGEEWSLIFLKEDISRFNQTEILRLNNYQQLNIVDPKLKFKEELNFYIIEKDDATLKKSNLKQSRYTKTQKELSIKILNEISIVSKKYLTQQQYNNSESPTSILQNNQFSNIQRVYDQDFFSKYCLESEEQRNKDKSVQDKKEEQNQKDQQNLSDKQDEDLILNDLKNITLQLKNKCKNNSIKNKIKQDQIKLFLIDLYSRKYTNIELIQCGGEGIVFQGNYLTKNKQVAIKLTKYDSEKEIDKQQYREREIVNSITCHKFIIKTIDQFRINNSLMIVQIMELCDYDLNSEIIKNQFTLQQIVNIFYQLINALIEIHTNNIIHFDIKPQNILKTANNEYKLTDFGMSNILLLNETDCNKINGLTVLFSSPEQYEYFENIKNKIYKTVTIGYTSDIFSMGLTFLQILGVDIKKMVQLDTSEYVKIAQAIRQGYWPREIQSGIKKEYLTLLNFVRYYMLNKDPDKRKRAIILKKILIRYYNGKNMELNEERDRIKSLINEIILKKIKYNKNKVYFHFLLGKISDNPEQNNKKLYHITKKIKGFYKKFFYFLDGQVTQQLNNKQIKQKFEESMQQEYHSSSVMGKDSTLNFDFSKQISLSLNYEKSENVFQKFNKQAITIKNDNLYQNFQERIKSLIDYFSLKYIKCNQYLAYLYCLMGQIEENPEKYLKKSLDIAKRIQGFSKQDYLYFQNEYGIAQLNNIKFKKAESNLKKCCDQRIQEQNISRLDVAESKMSLSLYFEKLGYFQKALSSDLESLKIRKENFPENHPEHAESLNRVGSSYILLDKYQEGLEYYLNSLNMRKQLFEGDHPDIAESYYNVAQIYYKLGNDEESIKYCELSLKMQESIQEGDSQNTAEVLHYLGIVYSKVGKQKESQYFFEKSLNMRQSLYKGDHPQLVQSYFTMYFQKSIAHENQKDVDKALEYYLKAYYMRKKIHQKNNPNHPDIAQSLNSLGIVYIRKKDFIQALHFCYNALQMRKDIYPEDHLFIAHSLNNVGYCYGQLNELNKALDYQFKSLTIRKKMFDNNDHSETAQAYRSIAITYFSNEKYLQSIKFNFKCLQMRKNLRDEGHPQNELILKQISDSYKALGDKINSELYENKTKVQKEKYPQNNSH